MDFQRDWQPTSVRVERPERWVDAGEYEGEGDDEDEEEGEERGTSVCGLVKVFVDFKAEEVVGCVAARGR